MRLTNLDALLVDGAGVTKRDLIDDLDGVRDRIVPLGRVAAMGEGKRRARNQRRGEP